MDKIKNQWGHKNQRKNQSSLTPLILPAEEWVRAQILNNATP